MTRATLSRFLCRLMAAAWLLFFGGVAAATEGGVTEIAKGATAPFDGEKAVGAVLTLPISTVPVDTQYQGGVFRTVTRKEKMERFRCSQCHNNKPVTVAKSKEMAHGDIAMVHGPEAQPLECLTCHKKDDRDFLVSEKGKRIDMDHSYQLCGQCHFRQKKDWVGGAHGKRMEFWAGERVVQNCAGCHDPHAPLFAKRWPKTFSRPLDK